jgi:hypothetical protein
MARLIAAAPQQGKDFQPLLGFGVKRTGRTMRSGRGRNISTSHPAVTVWAERQAGRAADAAAERRPGELAAGARRAAARQVAGAVRPGAAAAPSGAAQAEAARVARQAQAAAGQRGAVGQRAVAGRPDVEPRHAEAERPGAEPRRVAAARSDEALPVADPAGGHEAEQPPASAEPRRPLAAQPELASARPPVPALAPESLPLGLLRRAAAQGEPLGRPSNRVWNQPLNPPWAHPAVSRPPVCQP